jgi:sarcosine oxidase subunit beta
MVRDIFSSPEWIRFFKYSTDLWESISDELHYNVVFAQRGTLMVAFRPETMEMFRRCAALHHELGVRSRLVDGKQARELAPGIAAGVIGGVFGDSGGLARHDGLLWGYAVAADRLGVEIHGGTEATAITVRDGQVTGVRTTRGDIRTKRVINAAGGHGHAVGLMAGVDLPIENVSLEKVVTEGYKPALFPNIVSTELRASIVQTTKGEFVTGSNAPTDRVGLRSTYAYLKSSAIKMAYLYPALRQTSIVRQWTGLLDVTPDHAPIVGDVPGVAGLYLDAGWGYYGFMGAPGSGRLLSRWVLHGEKSPILQPFALERFALGKLVPDTMTISVHD